MNFALGILDTGDTEANELAAAAVVAGLVHLRACTVILATDEARHLSLLACDVAGDDGLEHEVGDGGGQRVAEVEHLAAFVDIGVNVGHLKRLLCGEHTAQIARVGVGFARDVHRMVGAHAHGVQFLHGCVTVGLVEAGIVFRVHKGALGQVKHQANLESLGVLLVWEPFADLRDGIDDGA